MGASNYHWINYDLETLKVRYENSLALKRGLALHDLANRLIILGVKLPNSRKTLNLYVNDAIGYRMSTEQVLYYSDNFFGTADAISFKKNVLRVHDLKTGATKASMHQLEIYAAFFCLEYGYNPHDIDIELRIYQNDEIVRFSSKEDETLKDIVANIMSTIISFDAAIEEFKAKDPKVSLMYWVEEA